MPADASQPRLPVARYRLHFVAAENLRLPEYAGSAWRGAFGRSLKRLVCVTRERVCPDCMLYRSCAYPYVFETPPEADTPMLRKVNAAPHPFVLLPEHAGPQPAGAAITLLVTLFGHGNRQLPYVLHALDQAGQHGIGRDRGALHLDRVAQHTDGAWPVIYRPGGRLIPQAPALASVEPCPPALRIRLHTPLRVKRDGRNVVPEQFDFAAFFGPLLRRISMLIRCHGETALVTDFADLMRSARAVPIPAQKLRWQDWTRYSSRQNTTMQLGGLVGSFDLAGPDLAPFWPYLWLGQWTHAGKGTSMGLGHYTIEALAAAA